MAVAKGFKQTEIGVVPSDWEIRSLSELSDKIMVGIASAATHAYRSRGIPMFRNQNIKPGYVSDHDLLFISEDYEANFKNKRLKANDLLTARTGYPGTTGIVPAKYEGAQSFTTLITRPRNDLVNVLYLNCYINSPFGQRFFEQNQIGGGQKNVNAGSLKNLPILIPAKKEQEAIANALSDADALIESLEKLIAKKRLIKKGAMRVLLDGTVQGSEPVRLSSVCWFQEGPGVRTHQFTSSGIKLLNGTNIKNGVLDLDVTTRFIGESEAYGPYRHFLADEGDIVIASSGITVDRFHEKVAIVKPENLPLCMNTSTIRFKPNEQLLDRRFLFQYLMSEDFKTQIGGQATGSAQLNFGPYHLNRIYIKLPTIEHQLQAAQVLNDLDLDISNLDRKIAKARSIKHGMMQELLTGRIRLI